MPVNRFFYDGVLEKVVTLEGDEHHHLAHVMRNKKGNSVELVNGKGFLAVGEVIEIQKREAQIEIKSLSESKPRLPPLKVIQALPKLSHLEWILQKGTELGVSHFYLFHSQQSEKKALTPHQDKRLQLVLKNAMKQCGRLDLPSLEWGFPKVEGPAFFGDLSEGAPLLKEVACLPATLIIGPEKGFTNVEIEELRPIARGVRIAPYTLRAETAAIAAIAQLCQS